VSIFDENIEYIGKKNPEQQRYIKSKMDEIMPDQTGVEVCRNKANGLNIKVYESDKEYYIHSNYNPDTEAEKWVASIDTNADIIVIFGLGLGYHIKKLKSFIKKEAKVYVIEPNWGIFKVFLENVKISDVLDDNFILSVGDTPENIAQMIFTDYKEVLLGKVIFEIYSVYKNLYNSTFEVIKDKFSDYIKVLTVNISTTEFFKRLWLMNFLMNILNLKNVINGKCLSDKFRGKPAIIVSAGPSLNKNIKLLEHAKNKAVIFAAGSSFRILKNHNITPDFTVAIDGSPLVKDIYDGLDAYGTTLIFFNRVFHEVVQAFNTHKVIFVDSEDKLTQRFAKKMGIDLEIVSPDQTVAGTCVTFASFMGCNPIIFVGQDFACTNLEFHADGAAHMKNYKEELKSNSNVLIKVKDIYGQDTYTLSNLLSSKLSMESKVADAIKKGHKFINATEGGIGVKNSENMDFKDVLNKYINKSIDISSLLNEVFSNEDCCIKLDNKKLCSYFEYIKSEAAVLKSKAAELNELCIKTKKELERKVIRPDKYAMLAQNVNIRQNEIEENDFYNEIILASITQSIAIHKIVMENNLKKSTDSISKNLTRIEFISKQMTEISELCFYLESFIENVYEPIYKKTLSKQ